MGLVSAWCAMLGYGLQIYFDFSGYSDMAIGLGRLFGIELPQNFNQPYRALNPSDFWRRWHITLSNWLRDYLYISLGGNRCSPGRRLFNLVLTMVLGGLWHGASWTFAAWGLYHGLLLVAYHKFARTWDALSETVQRGGTFVAVCLGWVLFRSSTFHAATVWYASLLGMNGLRDGASSGQLIKGVVAVSLGILAVNLVPNASPPGRLAALPRSRRFALGVVTAGSLVFLNQSTSFLYFQF
jgi:D-alanyl-lipoteichoic acid acyltransferase DltB (MBOAT superfamily)